jgi:hypothetical protein
MTSIIDNTALAASAAQQHHLSTALLDFNSDAGWKTYLNPHCSLRDIFFRQIYIVESFDREAAIQEILKSYIPMLIREYIKYNKGEGRKIPASDFREEIKQETASMILAWLLAECAELYKQSKVSRWKKTMSWL